MKTARSAGVHFDSRKAGERQRMATEERSKPCSTFNGIESPSAICSSSNHTLIPSARNSSRSLRTSSLSWLACDKNTSHPIAVLVSVIKESFLRLFSIYGCWSEQYVTGDSADAIEGQAGRSPPGVLAPAGFYLGG